MNRFAIVFAIFAISLNSCGSDDQKPDPAPPAEQPMPDCKADESMVQKADGFQCVRADPICQSDCSRAICGAFAPDGCGGICRGSCPEDGEVCSDMGLCESPADPCTACTEYQICEVDRCVQRPPDPPEDLCEPYRWLEGDWRCGQAGRTCTLALETQEGTCRALCEGDVNFYKVVGSELTASEDRQTLTYEVPGGTNFCHPASR